MLQEILLIGISLFIGWVIGSYMGVEVSTKKIQSLQAENEELKASVAHYRAPWEAANEHIKESFRRHETGLFLGRQNTQSNIFGAAPFRKSKDN